MARRRELKNIASGMLGSFVSRNNDVGGYWGIGKLCLLAQNCGAVSVKLDVRSKLTTPESDEFTVLLESYNSFLQRHLAARNIPASWVSSALIVLDFNPGHQPKKQVPIFTWGSLFWLSVSILDDRGKEHMVSAYGYCAPHNPRKEHQSIGERF